jgi:serine protease
MIGRRLLVAATAAPLLLVGIALNTGAAQAAPASRSVQTMSTLHGAHNACCHRSGSNLIYRGGPVETAPAVYLDFWGSWWNTTTTTGTDGAFSYTNAQAMQYVEDFFTNVGGSAWDGVTAQYCQGVAAGTVNCGAAGSHIQNLKGQLKGTMVDSANSVPSSPTQSQIAAEAAYAAGQFGLAAGSQPSYTVFVLTPSGDSENGFRTSWCAWHSVTSYGGGNLPYAYLPYQPDAGVNCGMNFVNAPNAYGNGEFDGFSVVGGHEYAEAATDPVTTNSGYGWLAGNGQEIGDLCAWNPASSDVTLGSHSYAVQPLWSNSVSGCAL